MIHSQEILRSTPIGKVEELIRLVYSPQCQHTHWLQVRAAIGGGKCQIKNYDTPYSYNRGEGQGGSERWHIESTHTGSSAEEQSMGMVRNNNE